MLWIIRFLSGERFRKATKEENAFGSALFVPVPIFIFAGVQIMTHSKALSNSTSEVFLWVCAVVGIVLFLLVTLVSARYIPARFSYLIAAVVCANLLFGALATHLIKKCSRHFFQNIVTI